MNDPLFDGIISLKLEFQELKSHIEVLTLRYGRSILTDAITSKIDNIIKDVDNLIDSYQNIMQVTCDQNQYKIFEDRLMLLKGQRDILTVFFEALNQHLNIINQINNKEILKCIENFKKDMITLANSHISLTNQEVCLLYSSTYKMTPLLADKGVFIVAMPIYDLRAPWYWTLISHEIGHIFHFQKSREVDGKLLPILARYLIEKAPEHVKRSGYVNDFIQMWRYHWLSELISDLFGCALFGASFTTSFISWLQKVNILEIENTHPPIEARVFVQLKYINEICPKDMVKLCEQYWNTLCRSVKDPRSQLGYPFDYEILEYIVNVFKELIPDPPIAKISDKILKIKKALDAERIEREEPLVMICGLAISEKKLELREDVLKAITEDL